MNKKVYLIFSEETGRYKIGISKNPSKRINQLQTGSGEKLKLIDSYESPHANKIEKTLHNRYERLNTVGEWFDLSLEQEVLFIKECQTIEKNIQILIDNQNHFI